MATKRPSLMQALGSQGNQKGIPRPPQYENADVRSNRSYFAKTQEEMWHEFNNHFRNPNRPHVKINHHDFLDGNFLTKLKEQQSRRTFFSQVGTQSLDRAARAAGQVSPYDDFKEADIDLGKHRLMKAKKNYLKM